MTFLLGALFAIPHHMHTLKPYTLTLINESVVDKTTAASINSIIIIVY